QRAAERSAHLEVIAHLSKGLTLLATLPDTPERAQHELVLQTTLGLAVIATKGYGSSEGERAYARARELSRQVGDTPQLFSALNGLWVFYLVRAELHTARALAEQLLDLAQGQRNLDLLVEAHRPLGYTLFNLGEFARCREIFEQGIALYDPQQH